MKAPADYVSPGEWSEPPAVGAPTFVGHNCINLNGATMNQIVQFWLSHKWAGETPTVTDVSYLPSEHWFKVTLKDDSDA